MALTDMTLDPADAKEEAGITPDAPKYPYGLQICLNDEVLEKLGITQLPKVGSVMRIVADVKVTGTRSYEIQTEKEVGEPDETSEQSVDLQITALEINDQSNAASLLYGG